MYVWSKIFYRLVYSHMILNPTSLQSLKVALVTGFPKDSNVNCCLGVGNGPNAFVSKSTGMVHAVTCRWPAFIYETGFKFVKHYSFICQHHWVFAQTDIFLKSGFCLFVSWAILCKADYVCLQNAGFVCEILAQNLLHIN